jgi:ketosteroid isomerase-like protein
MSTATNERLVRDYFEALGAGDLERLAGMISRDAKFHFAGGTGGEQPLVFDFEGLMSDLRNNLGKLYDAEYGIQPEILNLLAQDDRVAAEVRIRGRTAKGGAPYNNLYAFFFWIRDGKIVEAHEHLDTVYARERLLAPNGIATAAAMPWFENEA